MAEQDAMTMGGTEATGGGSGEGDAMSVCNTPRPKDHHDEKEEEEVKGLDDEGEGMVTTTTTTGVDHESTAAAAMTSTANGDEGKTVTIRSFDGVDFEVSIATAERIPIVKSCLWMEKDVKVIPFKNPLAKKENVEFMLKLLELVRLAAPCLSHEHHRSRMVLLRLRRH